MSHMPRSELPEKRSAALLSPALMSQHSSPVRKSPAPMSRQLSPARRFPALLSQRWSPVSETMCFHFRWHSDMPDKPQSPHPPLPARLPHPSDDWLHPAPAGMPDREHLHRFRPRIPLFQPAGWKYPRSVTPGCLSPGRSRLKRQATGDTPGMR